MRKILCVEDSLEQQRLIAASLSDSFVSFAPTLSEAAERVKAESFSLILLDLSLPDGDGIEFYSRFHDEIASTPLIVLSGKEDLSAKVTAFSLGVDDYLIKPVSPLELRARVKARIEKAENFREKAEHIRIGGASLDCQKHKLSFAHENRLETLDLTTTEFRLLLILARYPDRVFSRDTLLTAIWGAEVHVSDRTIDSHVSHLRKKLEKTDIRIAAVKGAGYRLAIELAQAPAS